MGSESASKNMPSIGTDQAALLLRQHVGTALINKAKGVDASKYNELLRTLVDFRKRVERDNNDEATNIYLAELVRAVMGNVSSIRNRKHETLVAEILSVKLWNVPQVVQTALLEFVVHLVVANTAFIHACLQLLVFSLIPPPAPQTEAASQGPWQPSAEVTAVQASVVQALIRVLSLVPTAPTNMLPLLVAQLPHKLRGRDVQCAYLSALFALAESPAGAPIKEALLTAVLEHVLSIDVEIKWEDIVDVPTGEDEEEVDGVPEEEDAEDIFELEGMSELDINATPEELKRRHAEAAATRGGWEGAVPSVHAHAHGVVDGGQIAAAEASTSGRPAVDETANKLDSMMELMFAHLGRRIEAGEVTRVWDTLLGAFERTVLNTCRSKFTQFLLFYTAHTAQAQPNASAAAGARCAESLVQLLLARLRDGRQPPITRSACAAYLASFLARAAFCPPVLVVGALQELVAFCMEYAQQQAVQCSAPSGGMSHSSSTSALANMSSSMLRVSSNNGLVASSSVPPPSPSHANAADAAMRHPVLYASVQAVLYVLCYHLERLVTLGRTASADTISKQVAQALEVLVREHIPSLLSSRLAPLEVCLPSVVNEFAHQVSALGLLDCAPLLPKVGPNAPRAQRPLEMFFPFDPYLLKRSSRFLGLKTSYVVWRHGHARGAAAAARGAQLHAQEDSDDEHGEEEGQVESSDTDEDPSSSSDSDAELIDRGSLQSDGILPDPQSRLATQASLKQLLRPTSLHSSPTPARNAMARPLLQGSASKRVANNPLVKVRGHTASSLPSVPGSETGDEVLMGTSYMSYASGVTSHGDAGPSPFGASPYDASMLVSNPLGTSPGAAPMSLGTPLEGHYMHQVPVRLAAAARR